MLSQKAKIRLGYLVAIILLVISYSLIFYNASQLNRQSRWISHSLVLVNKVDGILRLVTEAETSVRGYIITKNDSILQLYKSARKDLPLRIAEVRRLASPNVEQLELLDSLNIYTTQRIQLLETNINLFQQAGMVVTEEMKSYRDSANKSMNNVRRLGDGLIAQENNTMKEKTARFADFFRGAMNITIISLLIALLGIIFSLINYSRENQARVESDRKAIAFQEDLQKNIQKLQAINAEIKELRSIEKFAATGRVARTIAHEVRNPLTNISLATEQLREVQDHNLEANTLLDMVSRNALRINQLVSDLLNATRFIQLDMMKLNIKDVLEDTLELAHDRINLSNITVRTRFYQEPLFVMADRMKIKVAFLNIILNAIEAMEGKQGLLEVTTDWENGKCVVEISDNGTGMEEETVQSLFEPFFTKKPKGNGLGLTNTQNIILNHRGSITVKSEVGKGTTFRITLELA